MEEKLLVDREEYYVSGIHGEKLLKQRKNYVLLYSKPRDLIGRCMNEPHNSIEYAKMHGLGNKILVIDGIDNPDFSVTSALVLALSNSRNVHFDQLMFIKKRFPLFFEGEAAYDLEIWNCDGTRAKACGNGMSCVAEWLHREKRETQISFHTDGGMVRTRWRQEGVIAVDLGVPCFEEEDDGFASLAESFIRTLEEKMSLSLGEYFFVSMGNPHAVFFLKDRDFSIHMKELVSHIPEALKENYNLNFVFVENKNKIRLWTFERGAGWTKACGSGACASSVASIMKKQLDNSVRVCLRGGDLLVKWREEDDHVLMLGSAYLEDTGYLALESEICDN